MREIKVNELKEGMTTAVDVFSPKGQLILKRHQAVSAFDIAKFGFYNIASVYVEGSSAQEKEEWNKKYAIIKEKYRDSIDNLHEYMNDILYRNIIPDKNTLIRDSVEIFDRFETSYELFDALQVLKQTDVSTMAHSMNVSIIARLIGVWAGLDTEKLDEISMSAPTSVCEIKDGWFQSYEITPEQFGYERCSKDDLAGGTPAENAVITKAILRGEEKGPKRQAVCLNAGAALYIAGKAETMEVGVRMAEELIDSGAALKKLDEFIACSNE